MASTYIRKTFSTTGTSRQKFTLSMWIKRGSGLGAEQMLCECYSGSSAKDEIWLQSNDTINFVKTDGGGLATTTSAVFRDTFGWYNLVISADSTQASNANRVKIYINGVQQTLGQQDTIPQNANFQFGASGANLTFGMRNAGDWYFDGSMSHVHLIDGTAYDADTFGETDSTTGIWKPKTAPSVTYGTNGFFLKFENSAAFGTDSSGNSNTFTVNGTMTQNIDTPSNVFATLNPLARSTTSGNYSNGNLTFDRPGSTASWVNTVSTIGASSGKYYWEYKVIDAGDPQNGCVIGFMNIDGSDFQNRSDDLNQSSTEQNIGWYSLGNLFNQVSTIDTFNTYTDGDIIQLAMDLDNGYLYWGKNGTWENSADPTSGATGTGGKATSLIGLNGQYVFSIAHREDGNGSANFGNGYFGTTAVASAGTNASGIGIFEYDVPTGYTALSTKGLNL